MIRGTTAQFNFKLPYSRGELSKIHVVFWQPGNPTNPTVKKVIDNPTGTEQNVSVSLSVVETKQFSDRFKAKMQLKFTRNGIVCGCKPKMIVVYPMHDEIVDET